MSCLASNLITWLAPRSNMTAPSSHGITRPLNSMIGVPALIGRAANNPMPLIGDLRFCHSRFRRCSLISSLYSLIGCILPLSHPRRDQRLLGFHFFFAASITLLSSRHDTGPGLGPLGLKLLMCIAPSSARSFLCVASMRKHCGPPHFAIIQLCHRRVDRKSKRRATESVLQWAAMRS